MKNLWRLAFQNNGAAPGRKLHLLIYSIFVITQSSCVRWVAHGVDLCSVCIWKYSYCWYSYFRVSVVLCLANRRRDAWTNYWKRCMMASTRNFPQHSSKPRSSNAIRNSSQSRMWYMVPLLFRLNNSSLHIKMKAVERWRIYEDCHSKRTAQLPAGSCAVSMGVIRHPFAGKARLQAGAFQSIPYRAVR